MAENFEFEGYTIITSLSHGLLGPLKLNLDSLSRLSGSEHAFIGGGEVIGDFPEPGKTILVLGCTMDALFDDDLLEGDKVYREIFGDRVILEVQAYVKKIPEAQVRFRDISKDAGDIEEVISRLVKVFDAVGMHIDDNGKTAIADKFK